MTTYAIDTSSLVLLNRVYTQNTFPTVWGNVDELVRQNRLISHVEVFNETQRISDDLSRWCTSNKTMFVPNNQNIVYRVREIMGKYPPLVNASSTSANVADPFLIALALDRNSNLLINDETIVITEEKLSAKIKIPYVCSKYNITCTNLLGLFQRESWRF